MLKTAGLYSLVIFVMVVVVIGCVELALMFGGGEFLAGVFLLVVIIGGGELYRRGKK